EVQQLWPKFTSPRVALLLNEHKLITDDGRLRAEIHYLVDEWYNVQHALRELSRGNDVQKAALAEYLKAAAGTKDIRFTKQSLAILKDLNLLTQDGQLLPAYAHLAIRWDSDNTERAQRRPQGQPKPRGLKRLAVWLAKKPR